MKSKYKSGKSVGKNQTVPISVDDPRLAWNKIGQTKARQGAEIDVVGLDGKSLVTGGKQLVSGANSTDQNSYVNNLLLPPINNQPPSYYPGGSGPTIIVPTDPFNVTASWSGEDLVVQFDWDYLNALNSTISQFILELTVDGVTRRTPLNTFLASRIQTSQTIVLTKNINTTTFGIFRTAITSICVLTADPFNNISQTACAASVPVYILNLPIPEINVTAISNGYSVSYTAPTSSAFDAIDIWEIEDTGATPPSIVYSVGTVNPSNYQRSYFNNLSPANIITQNYNKRWVIARFSSSGGTYTAFSAAQATTPTSPVSIDNTPPNEVASVTGVWAGDNINISYTLPALDPASRVQIELTAPNTLVGFFYRFPSGSGTSQTAQITKRDLFDQFGEHYSSFEGILRSIDQSDNRSSGVSFVVAQRENTMATVTPTFTLTPLTNGYSVTATNYAGTTGINYMEVYAKHTPWTGDPENDDYVVYAGSTPAIIVDEDYTAVYVKIRYYDDFQNSSLYSVEDTVTPYGPGEITSFETPITFGEFGVIYAGADYSSGKRTVFKTDGIFAYDDTNIAPTTQIISNASTGTPTFITTQAQIADWKITDTKIENTLSGAPTSYTGLSATGPYSFWAGSAVSGGNEASNFTVTPSGEVTARDITIIGNGLPSTNLISAGGLFSVKNNGTLTATGATIGGAITAESGSITGNLSIGSSGSLTSGVVGQGSGNAGYILNTSGLRFDNGSTQGITTINGTSGLLTTTSANIGGWSVNSNSITKSSLSGGGNITLNSTLGYISVSNAAVSGYTAGINGTTTSSSSNAFWAGTGGATSTANAFRVTLDGSLYATGASITNGIVESSSALGSVKLDGVNNLISLKTTSSSSYLFPRNLNTYLTSGFPFGGTEASPNYSSLAAIDNNPYLSAGSGFKDYWNNDTKGIGIFTGAWDYFSTGSSTPFITATTTGLQLSASPNLGILLDAGTAATGSNLSPAVTSGSSMIIYTAKNASAPYSPTTTYGAWAKFQENNIRFSVSTNTYIDMAGSATFDTDGTISFRASAQRVDLSGTYRPGGINEDTDLQRSAYSGPSQIILNPTNGVTITGIASQQDTDMQVWYAGYQITPAAGVKYRSYDGSTEFVGDGVTTVYANGSYKNAKPLGPRPRQRMIVEDPVTGQMQLGLGIYYKIYGTGSAVPTSNTGFAGDIVIEY
jgi:hypothetical protein